MFHVKGLPTVPVFASTDDAQSQEDFPVIVYEFPDKQNYYHW